ncbi:MAG: Glu/Leu/Phe/Val dehydrogenase [Candidatus Omnitrophica bacterium]|nr:Glu/Leu/Phe/Val dehydrogenase [Candidatus Omnitrophota bacterium]MCB9747022.1 Glu/Leu/Phe/Val dehydrogenase [Candidatus Omnitrophota bacterium]
MAETDKIVPQGVMTVRDEALGLLGYVVVDRTINGHACGGLRIHKDLSIDELKALARGMTLKYGFCRMDQGGAKAGIVLNMDAPQETKQRFLRRFAELIEPLLKSGYYITGPDMGTEQKDILDMLKHIDMKIPKMRRDSGQKSGFYTALSVMVAAEACVEYKKMSWNGLKVAIEGFGAVGSSLALLLTRRKKAKIVAISTSAGAIYDENGLDVEKLRDLLKTKGSKLVDFYEGARKIQQEEVLTLDVDILAQCAKQYTINENNAHAIKASIITPGANNPITVKAEEILTKRGVLCIPYFCANCGGVMGNKMEVTGVSEDVIEDVIRLKNKKKIFRLIEIARKENQTLTWIAEGEALDLFNKMKIKVNKRHLKYRLYRMAVNAFNQGVVPKFLLKKIAPMYLRKIF